jgi:hypothetical protein
LERKAHYLKDRASIRAEAIIGNFLSSDTVFLPPGVSAALWVLDQRIGFVRWFNDDAGWDSGQRCVRTWGLPRIPPIA